MQGFIFNIVIFNSIVIFKLPDTVFLTLLMLCINSNIGKLHWGGGGGRREEGIGDLGVP